MITLNFPKKFYNWMLNDRKKVTYRLENPIIQFGDKVECKFKNTPYTIYKFMMGSVEVYFKDLNEVDAELSGYRYKTYTDPQPLDLLKNDLKCFYPNITDDTLLYRLHLKGYICTEDKCWDYVVKNLENLNQTEYKKVNKNEI